MQSKLAALGYREIRGQPSNYLLENLKQKDMNFIIHPSFHGVKMIFRMLMKQKE